MSESNKAPAPTPPPTPVMAKETPKDEMSESNKAPTRTVVVNETEEIDLSTELKNMKQSDQLYIKRMEAFNKDRVKKLKILRGRNLLIGIGVTAGVVGIYSYTMKAVKQEGFLDDFDPPIPPSERELVA